MTTMELIQSTEPPSGWDVGVILKTIRKGCCMYKSGEASWWPAREEGICRNLTRGVCDHIASVDKQIISW
ncbi:Uncharacterized protein HZ326_29683 [Fusarium oxysporum f. sp. albedinis]|nr:Uncharacterized protein HZ326_29683 [Fusarium oxysporum f. sp. albedinis]